MSSTDAADMTATITVVIPTFNRSGMLRRALASVLEEQRVPIRVTVIDNASTDDTPAVIAELVARDPRITYIRNGVNLGSIGNYTKGLATVITRYFIPLADDDFLLPGFVHEAYGIMERDRTLGAVIFSTEQRTAAGQVTGRYPSSPNRLTFGRLMPAEHLREWMTYGHYAWSSVLWNADVLRTIGFPYLHIGLPSDVDFQAQIFCYFSVFLVDKPGAVFYEHPGQASGHFSIAQIRVWAELFARLDRSVAKSKIFNEAEYALLRDIMWHRYRGIWNIIPSMMPDAAEVAKVAAIAKTRLGDEELGLRLREYARLHGVAETTRSTIAVTQQECDEPAAEPHVTYARNSEDIVLWRALGAVKGGYYVDIGAGDPTRHSVTKIFYDRGWCGVNVESARARHETLVRERSRDLSLHLLLVAKFDPEPVLVKPSAEPGDTLTVSDAPAATVTQLLASLPTREIHFLRLGFDRKATGLLEGIDLCSFRPWVILVRADVPGCDGPSAAWEEAWLNCGYLRALSDGHNIFFVAEEHRDLLQALCAALSEASVSVAAPMLKSFAVASPMSRLARSAYGFVPLFAKPAFRTLLRFVIRSGV